MKFLKVTLSPSQIKALLRKDVIVRMRQPWMTIIQFMLPWAGFLLLYLIRLKFGPENVDDCQFPTRLLPTKNNVLPAFYSYICTIENKCMSTKEYQEYTNWDKAPMKPIVDIVQIFINNDNMFNSVIELPIKANFISAVTTLVTGGHMDEVRRNVEKVIDLVPEVEKYLNGSFDIKKLFSDRKTFVNGGYLLCGHPFPSSESIPLVNDILYSEDFSDVNDDELKAMPTKYCKKLYMDVTSSNHGKITWNVIKPLIHGKILYGPDNTDTQNIMKFSNSTFEELSRLKMLSVALEQILTKLRVDEPFIKGFEGLLKLAQSPFVRSIIGNSFDIDQIEAVMNRIRTDPIIYDVIQTIKNLLECFSVDRFIPVNSEKDLRVKAFELNKQRLFYAAVYFNKTAESDIIYKMHMDTDNTQPTMENKNRFWFPGPSRSMIRDLKYHRGFVQIKQSIDLGIIKHKKELLRTIGVITDRPSTTTKSPFSIRVIGEEDGNGNATTNDDDDDDDWFTSDDNDSKKSLNTSKPQTSLILSLFNGVPSNGLTQKKEPTPTVLESGATISPIVAAIELDDEEWEEDGATTTNANADEVDATTTVPLTDHLKTVVRHKRQSFFDMFFGAKKSNELFQIDKMRFYTKQFPYPAYIDDDFKTGIYLAQAVQVVFFLGLVAHIASCVRHRIWMRESRNSMIMRSMGLKPCSEMTAWTIVTFVELLIIFIGVTIILYIGGILAYTSWLFIMLFLVIWGICLIAFCYMCSTFFTSATIGAVATAIFFFISFCPYIIVLLFDAKLNSLQSFGINLSFTTAFAHAWSHIMRLELQQIGLTSEEILRDGLHGEFGFGLVMIVLDTIIYLLIGYVCQRYKDDEYRFVEVQRDDLDASLGATLTNVSKSYDDSKFAVSNISLSFPRNQVTCLLGRNGAGKSTIIKMLTGQVVQTTGRVILSQAMSSCDDYDKVGVCSQDNILIPNLTAREHLEMYAKIKLKHGYKSEVEKTLKSLNFGHYESYQASQLSGGYQRRLCVAIAFIGSPNVVILDEPCNGIDTKARKDIWELIERLRKGRAVVFATHFLDEAEFLSNAIIIMKNGKIIAKHNPETLKNHCTEYFEISLQCRNTQICDDIILKANKLLNNYKILENVHNTMKLEVGYDQQENNSAEFIEYLEELQREAEILELNIESKNLEQIFKQLDQDSNSKKTNNGHTIDIMRQVQLNGKHFSADLVREEPLTRREAIHELFWKRLVHFSRNYRMLLCVLIIPAIFEILAMWFVTYRLEDDFDKSLRFGRDLYPKSTQVLSIQNPTNFTRDIYKSLKNECSDTFPCKEFGNSSEAFYWILNTLNQYHDKRYGGYTFNQSNSIVWYNNKGYHAMMSWLNDLSTHILQTELNDTEYNITTYNEPLKLGDRELSTTSVLRQSGDSAMVFILIIAFSLVIAVASVYLVNERTKGEKLQQKLCGVDAATYWGVAFVWDFLIMVLSLLVCTAIILAFGMPVFVDRQQLWGIIVLTLLFSFACIPAVHVFEKIFSDASVAIVTIFCMNIIIPLFTLAVIVLLGVIGDSETWDDWRYFLNRAFLIFPQHALGDGLIELCKNYMVAQVFHRYDIDSYKNPVYSDLLRPHFISLFVLGVFFMVLNVLIESGLLYRWKEYLCERIGLCQNEEQRIVEELKIISIQNSLKRNDKYDAPQALKVDNLCKAYRRGLYAVKNVTFAVKSGECFGLLGKNGAGKSTIFKMLSGQMEPSIGDINYFEHEISYCPQTNTLDSLLTVKECIEFYGRLRRINDIPKLVGSILESFQLESYRDVLVKNLSGGNRRKLTVATSCLGRTSVVLMDEPTSDMDPVTRAIVYRTIEDLIGEHRAIVLTSHSISEIDEICHRIGVLKDGQMLTCSSPESLKAQYGGFYNIVVFCDTARIAEVEKEIRQRFPQCHDLQAYSNSIKFCIKIETPKEAAKVQENGIDVPPDHALERLAHNSLSLNELFRRLNLLAQESSIRFTVNRCRLDTVFERVLDSNENGTATLTQHTRATAPTTENGYLSASAFNGSPSLGYVHNGYVETETVT